MIAENNIPPTPQSRPRFLLGHRFATPGAMQAMEAASQNPLDLFGRHEQGDWGDVDLHDREANEIALDEGNRILSAYTLCTGAKLWVITEADRSVTTILRPDEY